VRQGEARQSETRREGNMHENERDTFDHTPYSKLAVEFLIVRKSNGAFAGISKITKSIQDI